MSVNKRVAGRTPNYGIRTACIAGLIAALIASSSSTASAQSPGRDEAASALQRAVAFFRDEVSAEGGYLWRYSSDLQHREGEGKAGPLTAWVQPPGTPSVGEAFLEAFEGTGDAGYLEAARETGMALVRGQLVSGGWDYRIEFDPDSRRRYRYRVDRSDTGRNTTTLDDDTTQSALRFLMRLDRALEFGDEDIHDAVVFGLESLLKAQYPNGAWPQRFSSFPDPAEHPVLAANYPESWPREWPDRDYRGFYTFNDNTIADLIETMFDAAEVYGDDRYRASAEKAGGFILLAQMPEPQPVWAQQYDADMHPAWARKFEPPAVTGGESQGVLRTLLSLYRRTADRRYLEPIPRALEYLNNSLLPDGRLARFYELKTNRPLFFTRKYVLTYESNDLPTHYGFLVSPGLDAIEAEYDRLSSIEPQQLRSANPRKVRSALITPELAARAGSIVRAQDDRGAWVEDGRLRTLEGDGSIQIIDSRTFCNNVRTLSHYIAALDAAGPKE